MEKDDGGGEVRTDLISLAFRALGSSAPEWKCTPPASSVDFGPVILISFCFSLPPPPPPLSRFYSLFVFRPRVK